MGIRQSAQPLGVAIAAPALPSVGAHGRPAALAFLGTFALVFLVDAHGLAPVTAGRLLAIAQACGAFSRRAGAWSDRAGSRMRPMRALALATALTLAAVAAGAAVRAPWAIALLLAEATPPVLAAVIGAAGYAVAFGVVTLFPLAAATLVPVAGERRAAAQAARAAAPGVPAGR